jgi:hypothetical protein
LGEFVAPGGETFGRSSAGWDTHAEREAEISDFWNKLLHPERPITPTVGPWGITPSAIPTMTPSPTETPQFTPTSRPTSSYLHDQIRAYGISTTGNVDANTMQVILNTAQLLGKNYMPIMGAQTPQAAFLRSNGPILIYINDKAVFFDEKRKIVPGNCETRMNIPKTDHLNTDIYYVAEYTINEGTKTEPSYVTKQIQTLAPQTIVCKLPPTEENLMHEFGHTTPNHVRFDIFSNIESIQTENGTFIDHNKNGYWERQDKGFLKGDDSLEHKISENQSRVDGYAKVEQLADMLMNWNMEQAGSTTHGFSNDADGRARRDFIEGLIHEMLVRQ